MSFRRYFLPQSLFRCYHLLSLIRCAHWRIRHAINDCCISSIWIYRSSDKSYLLRIDAVQWSPQITNAVHHSIQQYQNQTINMFYYHALLRTVQFMRPLQWRYTTLKCTRMLAIRTKIAGTTYFVFRFMYPKSQFSTNCFQYKFTRNWLNEIHPTHFYFHSTAEKRTKLACNGGTYILEIDFGIQTVRLISISITEYAKPSDFSTKFWRSWSCILASQLSSMSKTISISLELCKFPPICLHWPHINIYTWD